MTLLDLLPGTRFEMIDTLPPVRGTLVKVTDCRAVVELDATPRVKDFETGAHRWVRIHTKGKRRLRVKSITPYCQVRVIQ